MSVSAESVVLQTVDYVVIALMLTIPMAIGVFFAVRDAKNNSRLVYLLGGRKMAMVPVTLSMFASFQSAVSLLGIPNEVVQFGPMFFAYYVGVSVCFAISYYTLVPLLYPLRLTSVYEYLEMRFQSKFVRMLSTVTGMLQVFFYMAVSLLAPGLALEAAAGIPLWMSVVIVGVTGTVYTCIGGIKSVIWTDAFQVIVVFVGLFVIIYKACYEVGGPVASLEIAEAGGRTSFKHFSFDPRVRHTWLSIGLGGAFTWMSNMFGQSTFQRISSMKTQRDAGRSMLISIPLHMFYVSVVTLFGWVMFAYFVDTGCDPFVGGLVTNANQRTPYFVIQAARSLPGVSGLFMSSLFSGALSTVSSGINSLAANTVEDLLARPLKSVTEKTATVITKAVVFLYGLAIIGTVYLCKNLQGNVTSLAISVFGTFGSAVFGIFLLGSCVPWTNRYGAVAGTVAALTLNLWLIIGSMMYRAPSEALEPIPSDGCTLKPDNSTINPDTNVTGSSFSSLSTTVVSSTVAIWSNVSTSSNSTDMSTSFQGGFSPYDISYEWISVIGTLVCFLVGLIVSRITFSKSQKSPDPKLILPFLRNAWRLSLSEETTVENTDDVTNGWVKDSNDERNHDGVRNLDVDLEMELLVSRKCNSPAVRT